MTKGADCDAVVVDRWTYAGCDFVMVERTECKARQTYDFTLARADRRMLEPPLCTCPPMLEPWEMI